MASLFTTLLTAISLYFAIEITSLMDDPAPTVCIDPWGQVPPPPPVN